jgi:hypothetical protein
MRRPSGSANLNILRWPHPYGSGLSGRGPVLVPVGPVSARPIGQAAQFHKLQADSQEAVEHAAQAR